MSAYKVDDWIFAEGIGMAQVTERVSAGFNDWLLTCRPADQPNASFQVRAKNVEPGENPNRFLGPYLICVDGVRVA